MSYRLPYQQMLPLKLGMGYRQSLPDSRYPRTLWKSCTLSGMTTARQFPSRRFREAFGIQNESRTLGHSSMSPGSSPASAEYKVQPTTEYPHTTRYASCLRAVALPETNQVECFWRDINSGRRHMPEQEIPVQKTGLEAPCPAHRHTRRIASHETVDSDQPECNHPMDPHHQACWDGRTSMWFVDSACVRRTDEPPLRRHHNTEKFPSVCGSLLLGQETQQDQPTVPPSRRSVLFSWGSGLGQGLISKPNNTVNPDYISHVGSSLCIGRYSSILLNSTRTRIICGKSEFPVFELPPHLRQVTSTGAKVGRGMVQPCLIRHPQGSTGHGHDLGKATCPHRGNGLVIKARFDRNHGQQQSRVNPFRFRSIDNSWVMLPPVPNRDITPRRFGIARQAADVIGHVSSKRRSGSANSNRQPDCSDYLFIHSNILQQRDCRNATSETELSDLRKAYHEGLYK